MVNLVVERLRLFFFGKVGCESSSDWRGPVSSSLFDSGYAGRKRRTKGMWEDIANNKKLKIVESKREKMSGEDCIGKEQNVERGNRGESSGESRFEKVKVKRTRFEAKRKLELLLSLARRWSLTLESCESRALSEKQAEGQ
jgi:hypothetical protein